MRILKCRFRLIDWLTFSETGRRLVVSNGERVPPYFEVHHALSHDTPAVLDQLPHNLWVTGYSDAAERLRFLSHPSPSHHAWLRHATGEHGSRVGVSADERRAVFANTSFLSLPGGTTILSGYSRTAAGKWSRKWLLNNDRTEYGGPMWLFAGDERVVMVRTPLMPPPTPELVVRRVSTGRELAVSPPITGRVMRITSVGRQLAAIVDQGSADKPRSILRIFADDTVDAGSVELPHRGQVTALAADPFSRFLLSASGTKVTAWDPVTWKPLHRFDWKIGKVTCLAVSPDGTIAAAGGDKGKVAVWDVG